MALPVRDTLAQGLSGILVGAFLFLGSLGKVPVMADTPQTAPMPNRLIHEASPYLRQHADNPIDWYPWGQAAFDKARRENKPIFLSIGYATCYWCHVMEKESFSDPEVGRLLNAHFVSIKVDRERRPDVDDTYMLATQLMTRTGGWPNNLFLTPDLKPFFAGTYFPKEAFLQIVQTIASQWQTNAAALQRDGETIAQAVSRLLTRRVAAQELTEKRIRTAGQEILQNFDDFHGGFGTAPKFPTEPQWLFLLHLAARYGDEAALSSAWLTLDNILAGGIHDHVGGGFHRYAVDNDWRVPHFEKMLYTQAQLVQMLLRAHALGGKSHYLPVVRKTLDFVLREMQAPEGGFYSAYDAGEPGAEGVYYLWTPEAVRQALGEEAPFAFQIFDITEAGNFEHSNILYFAKPLEELAEELGLTEAALLARAEKLLTRLRQVREKRPKPRLDAKILTAWNGLMIAALAEAGDYLNAPVYLAAAEKAATFLWNAMRGPEGRLFRTHFEGRAAVAGQQEDYAFLALGYLALFDATGQDKWRERAEELVAHMNRLFRDETAGDYVMAAADAGGGVLGVGPVKARADSATPAGNAVALEVLAKLSRRSASPEHRNGAEALLAALSGLAMEAPFAHATTLRAADMLLRGEVGQRVFLSAGRVQAHARRDPETPTRLIVTLTVENGWHVNSNKPLSDYLVPTRLTVLGAEGKAQVTYPEGQVRTLAFQADPLSLYEGEVPLTVNLPQAMAAKPVRLELEVQACSDRICLAPETGILIVPGSAS